MRLIDKLEKKMGRFAIRNLMYYVIILYAVGAVIGYIMPNAYYEYLSLDAEKILSGQIWRIFTFLMQPSDTNLIFLVFFLYLYYMIGSNLEHAWGAFRFNLYFFTGVVFHVLAAIILYLITGYSYLLTTTYLNMSLFLAFAVLYPNVQFLLFFIIPVKVKYLAYLDVILFAWTIITGSAASRIAALLSLANFLIFYFATRDYNRISPKEIRRKQVYRREVHQARGITKHKCAVCGRTELDGDDLVFRFCSKCDGNYEYCQDHLFTHEHVKKN